MLIKRNTDHFVNITKVIIIGLLIISLLIEPCDAGYPRGEFHYSNFLEISQKLEWEVHLEKINTSYTDYHHCIVEGVELQNEDNITLKILQDPDDPTLINYEWYDIYLNGISIGNSLSILKLYRWGSGDFFISPVTFTNEAGNFDFFEEYYNYVKNDHQYCNQDIQSTNDSEEWMFINVTEALEFTLDEYFFTSKNYYCEKIDGKSYDEKLIYTLEVVQESVVDVQRGVLKSFKFNVDYFYNYTHIEEGITFEEALYHLLIGNTDESIGYVEFEGQEEENDESNNNTPFGENINFIVIGLLVFSVTFAIGGAIYKSKKMKSLKQGRELHEIRREKCNNDDFRQEVKRILNAE